MTYIARRHNVAVPVAKNGRGWCVSWRERAGAPRIRKTFTDYDTACQFAEETALRVANGTKRGLGMTDAQVAEYLTICRECGDTPPLAAVREWASARRILGGLSIIEASTAHAAKNSTIATIPPTSELLASMVQKLTARDCQLESYVARLACDLAPFAAAFPNLREVSTAHLETYLHTLRTRRPRNVHGEHRPAGSTLSKRRRDNIRNAIATLFSHAQDAGYLAPGPTPATKVPKLDKGPDIGTYTPEQMARIIAWFDANAHDYLPWIVIGAFAGLRSSEVERLHWSAFAWEDSVIHISKTVAAKTKTTRFVPILPALETWLRPWHQLTEGRVVPREGSNRPSKTLSRLRIAMCREFGWTHWEPNALRHSYASYRARFHVRAVVAEEMGNSVAMLKKFYDALPPKNRATAYFDTIRPTIPTNITHIKSA